MSMTRTLCAVRGLVGVTDNHGRTSEADRMLVDAIAFSGTDCSTKDEDEMVEKIHAFMRELSPDCSSCAFPCGNTSDYDITLFENNTHELQEKKNEVITMMVSIARQIKGMERMPEDKVSLLYKCMTYITLDLALESYDTLFPEGALI